MTKVKAPAEVLVPFKQELMSRAEAFQMISHILTNNDPSELSVPMLEAIRYIVDATGYDSEFQAPEAE
jgi:hypothetical protein